jgi:hypothetical protein
MILLDLIKNKNVAIVGPSSFLVSKNLGKLIDNNDIVIKINRFEDLSSVDYGTKIDILFHNFYDNIPDKSINNSNCKLIVAGHPFEKHINSITRFKKSEKIYHKIPHEYYPEDELSSYVKNVIIKDSWKTTGFWIVCFLLDKINLIKKLSIFGIDFCFNKYNNKYNGSNQTPGHDMNIELSSFRELFHKYNSSKKIIIYDKIFLKYLNNNSADNSQYNSVEFINSDDYEEEMNKYLDNLLYDNNEAELLTKNYKYRHHTCKNKLKLWRWRGMYQNKSYILNIIKDKKTIIDFGGASCPFEHNSIIVDFQKKDCYGNKINYHYINDIPSKVDLIFSSHCLEHIENLEDIFTNFKLKLTVNGELLFLLPAWTCKRWRYGIHKNSRDSDHKWTLALSNDNNKDLKNIKKLLYIDTFVNKFFKIVKSEYCGDNSIFMHCINFNN